MRQCYRPTVEVRLGRPRGSHLLTVCYMPDTVLSIFTYVTRFNPQNNLESSPHFTGSVQLNDLLKAVPLTHFRVEELSPGQAWLLNLWCLHYPAVPTLGLAFNNTCSFTGQANDCFPAHVSCHWGQTPQAVRGRHLQPVPSSEPRAGGLMIPAAFSPISSFALSACTYRQG